jgi:hypothetical protein
MAEPSSARRAPATADEEIITDYDRARPLGGPIGGRASL